MYKRQKPKSGEESRGQNAPKAETLLALVGLRSMEALTELFLGNFLSSCSPY